MVAVVDVEVLQLLVRRPFHKGIVQQLSHEGLQSELELIALFQKENVEGVLYRPAQTLLRETQFPVLHDELEEKSPGTEFVHGMERSHEFQQQNFVVCETPKSAARVVSGQVEGETAEEEREEKQEEKGQVILVQLEEHEEKHGEVEKEKKALEKLLEKSLFFVENGDLRPPVVTHQEEEKRVQEEGDFVLEVAHSQQQHDYQLVLNQELVDAHVHLPEVVLHEGVVHEEELEVVVEYQVQKTHAPQVESHRHSFLKQDLRWSLIILV